MPTTMTLEGVRMNRFTTFLRNCGPRLRGLGDAYSDEAAAAAATTGGNPVSDFTIAAAGWGILAFAVGTVALRGFAGAKKLFR